MAAQRNVELKARDRDPEATLALALRSGASDEGVLHQVDTYFRVATGRLKLREQTGPDGVTTATLVPYVRADEAVARTSSYRLVEIADPETFKAGMAETAGIEIVVEKRRHLLLKDNVRIHLDDVQGLGSYVELEAVVPDGGDPQAEHAKVAELVQQLGMTEVVPDGYAQLLARRSAPQDLVQAAIDVMPRAYARHSAFHVGAAVRAEDGRIFSGANVENASYPEGWCAEASAIAALIAAGATAVTEVAVAADTALITPCGGCRQRLREFAQPDTKVHLCGPEGVRRTLTLQDLLPHSFTEDDL